MQPFHSALLLCNYVQLYSSLFYAHSRPESAHVRAVLLSRVYAKQHLVKNRTFEKGEKKKLCPCLKGCLLIVSGIVFTSTYKG